MIPQDDNPGLKVWMENPYHRTIPATPATASDIATMSTTNINQYLHGPDIPWNPVEPLRWYDPSAVIDQFEWDYNKAPEQDLPMSHFRVPVCSSTSSAAPHASFSGDVYGLVSAATPSSESMPGGTSIPSVQNPNGKTSSHRSRKKMNAEEKESYKQMRELGSCDKCRKGKRKVGSISLGVTEQT